MIRCFPFLIIKLKVMSEKIMGYNFGHRVVSYPDRVENDVTIYSDWVYEDNGEPNSEYNYSLRKCPKCNMSPTEEGHDPCIANLPGVKFACCGHGVERAYIMLNTGECYRFDTVEELREFIDKL